MNGFRILDRILRGERPDSAVNSVSALIGVTILLAALYGCFMGSFGIFGRSEPEFWPIFASAVKVPALFFLTLLVTFPSLYIFNTILGTRLYFGDLLRLVSAGIAVLIAVLASLGPIVAFFSATTVNYPFILLLNVVVFALSGVFGISFLFRMLKYQVIHAEIQNGEELQTPEESQPEIREQESTSKRRFRKVTKPESAEPAVGKVFYVWMFAFGLVGMQMAWVLRPFVGDPHLPFAWFRPREASFFAGLWRSIELLLGIDGGDYR